MGTDGPDISGTAARRIWVAAIEIESVLRGQLVADALAAHRVSGIPAGDETGSPGYGYVDVELPTPASFYMYPALGPDERAAALSSAADAITGIIAILPDLATGSVVRSAVDELSSVKREIRECAESLFGN